MSSKSVHGREAKSLKNGIPTLCKGLQFNSSASPCRPPKQTNKQTIYRFFFEMWFLRGKNGILKNFLCLSHVICKSSKKLALIDNKGILFEKNQISLIFAT